MRGARFFRGSPFAALEGRPLRLAGARLAQAPPGCAELTAEEWNAIVAEKQAAWEAGGKQTLDEVCAVVTGLVGGASEFRSKCWYPDGTEGGQSGAVDAAAESYVSCRDNWCAGQPDHPACVPATAEPTPTGLPPTPSLSPPPQAPPPFRPPLSHQLPPGPPAPHGNPFVQACPGTRPIQPTPLNAFGLGFKRRSMF